MTQTVIARQDTSVPRVEQLTDLFENAAVAFAITDAEGQIILQNKAIRLLAETASSDSLVDVLGGNNTLLDTPVTELLIDRPGSRYPSIVIHTTFVDDPSRIYWVVRPVIEGALPTPENHSAATSDSRSATDWAADLGEDTDARAAVAGLSAADAELRESEIERFIAELPIAIHLIGPAGIVEESNISDLDIVNFGAEPNEYVGHHIRQIYDDQGVVDNFLNQWDDGTPIINFNTRFVQRGGSLRPVRIFSNSRVVDGEFVNTRCVVFEHNTPDFKADSLQAFSFPPRNS